MDIKVRSAAGFIMVISGLPAFAQDRPTLPASSASAPPPPPPSGIMSPGDPTWFVAGFVAGLVVGYVAGKVLGNDKSK